MEKKRSKDKTPPPLYDRALALAARRLRSTSDLRKKLLAEGYDGEAVEAALVRLKEIYLLDDGRMAQAVSRHYKDRGNRFIAQKLREKGIVADEHGAALDELPDEFERALSAGEKKLRNLGGVEEKILRQKVYQHLAARGFAGATVQKVVRQLTRATDDDSIED